MKKATRQFLKQRPKAEYVKVTEIEVKGALANHCFENALNYISTNETELTLVCGWMVGDYFGVRGTPIIPHYWVFNVKTNQHFDPTPKPKNNIQTFEYVMDLDILIYGKNDAFIPLSLKLLDNEVWQARNKQGTGYIDLDKVDVRQLYELSCA